MPEGSIARALVGSPLRRPVFGCLFVVIMLLLLGVALLGHLLIWVDEPLPALQIFLQTLGLAAIASLPALLVIWYLDRRERESIWLIAGAILWGAVISTGLAGLFNALGHGFLELSLAAVSEVNAKTASEFATAALVAPFVEESAKGAALLLLIWFLRAEFDNLRDGLIYGALVGMGFNIAEVALYVMKGFVDTGIAPYGEQFAVRFVFLGLNGHLIWCALCGAGLGIARQTSSGCLRWFAPICGYAVAVLGHMLNNSVGVITIAILLSAMGFDLQQPEGRIPPAAMWIAAALMNLIIEGLCYVLIGILLFLSAQWERMVIRTFLADEIGTIVTTDEYREINKDRPLVQTRRLELTTGRKPAAIINAQNELAFRKWHLQRDNLDPGSDPLVAAWRRDIEALRE